MNYSLPRQPSISPSDLSSEVSGTFSNLSDNLKSMVSQNVLPGIPNSPSSAIFQVNSNIFDPYVDLNNLSSENSQIDPLDFSRIYGYNLSIHTNEQVLQIYNFVIPPQHISISVPPATNLSVTMKGIVEDHNGAPLRRISIKGTTGILPIDPLFGTANGGKQAGNNALESLFKNTIQSAVRVVNQFTGVVESVKSIFTSSELPAPLNWKNEELSVATTGYERALALYRFLDGYLAMKKNHSSKSVRLCFEMLKDKMYYDCTVNDFSIAKLPGTLEYEYSISLTAWKRLPNPPSNDSRTPQEITTTQARDLNFITAIVRSLRKTRKLLASSAGVLEGIRGDAEQSFFEPLREVILIMSTATAAWQSIIDFPKSIVESYSAAIKAAIEQRKGENFATNLKKQMLELGYFSTDNIKSNYGSVDPTKSAIDSLLRDFKDKDVAELSTPENKNEDDLTVALKDPRVAILLEDIALDELSSTAAQLEEIRKEIQRLELLTADDWRQKRDQMESFVASISESLGGGNATYNRVYGRNNKRVNKPLRTDDILLLSQLNDTIISVNSMINYLDEQNTSGQNDYYSYYASLARENGITFEENRSKFYVPFPYGATMESLAVQYLGDANRWIEISALNGLRAPYIDEEGFEIVFSGTGSGNSVTLPNSDNLYIGQTVLIYSDTEVQSPRKITGIDNISEIESVVTLNGESNLSKYKSSDNAKLKAFMPNTVNSFKMIAIPSPQGTGVDGRIKVTPTPKDLDPIMLVAKTDFLLQSDGDLAISSSGEIGLATGLTNIIQAANIKLLTRAGSIISDPRFGNPMDAGQSTAEASSSFIVESLSRLFADDPRFGPVLAASVNKKGVTCEISILIRIAGTNINLPLVTELPL